MTLQKKKSKSLRVFLHISLIQAALGCLAVQEFALSQDTQVHDACVCMYGGCMYVCMSRCVCVCECATGGLHAFMCLCFLMHPRNFEVHDACVCMYGGGGGCMYV